MISEEELANKYPEMFELWHKEPDEIDGPAPQICIYGFQCDEGWNHLIDSVCYTLDTLDVTLTIHQIKQKFGGLRFYHSGIESDDMQKTYMATGAIRNVENMSRRVCEQCGSPASKRDDGWIRTRCDDCYDSRS